MEWFKEVEYMKFVWLFLSEALMSWMFCVSPRRGKEHSANYPTAVVLLCNCCCPVWSWCFFSECSFSIKGPSEFFEVTAKKRVIGHRMRWPEFLPWLTSCVASQVEVPDLFAGQLLKCSHYQTYPIIILRGVRCDHQLTCKQVFWYFFSYFCHDPVH